MMLRRSPERRAVSRGLASGLALAALCLASQAAAQDTSPIAPGDARVDGLRIRPSTRHYAIYQVVGTATAPERVGQLIERVQLLRVGADTVIIQTRERMMNVADTSVDSLTLDRRTLAPLAQREAWNRRYPHKGWLHRGTDFSGDSASHFGPMPEESIDRAFSRPAFFDGTEDLLLMALRNPRFVTPGASFAVATWSYGKTFRPLLEQSEALVHVRGSSRSPIPTHRGDVWVLRFGQSIYWVTKDSLEVLQWEEYPDEAGFSYRFVLEGD